MDIIEKIKDTLHKKGECPCCDDIYELLTDFEEIKMEKLRKKVEETIEICKQGKEIIRLALE